MQQRNNWKFIQRSLDIKSTIKYKNNGCTRQAANPQHIAKNWLNRQFHASMPNEKWNLAGKIDLIVTKSVSRFARNTADSLTTVRKLKEKGVELIIER